jgi:hypothetical protein
MQIATCHLTARALMIEVRCSTRFHRPTSVVYEHDGALLAWEATAGWIKHNCQHGDMCMLLAFRRESLITCDGDRNHSQAALINEIW